MEAVLAGISGLAIGAAAALFRSLRGAEKREAALLDRLQSRTLPEFKAFQHPVDEPSIPQVRPKYRRDPITGLLNVRDVSHGE